MSRTNDTYEGKGSDMRAVLVVVSLFFLAACGGGTSSPTKTTAALNLATVAAATLANQPVATTTDAVAPTGTVAHATSSLDATAVGDKLKAAGLPITITVVYTATTDPNHLLGRPNQYLSKIAFADTRVAQTDPSVSDAIDNGGSVEVFATLALAQQRTAYIQAFSSLAPEYDYLRGGILLRLSHMLTPDQAKSYQQALGS